MSLLYRVVLLLRLVVPTQLEPLSVKLYLTLVRGGWKPPAC
jgi:hypothetical protein